MARKTRSVFWVVSTHVLTTGFVVPGIASWIGYELLMGAGKSDPS